eukprot:GHVR01187359.1.p2 GENE.GHVR01187359.1~~GHVR01187359.1.p2  ORF type:complete len:118 (+),score=24.53 GHVR01187359.1:123-476(+)
MKIICEESLRVATLSGAVVLFEAGVPREVGEEIGKAALVMGADIVSSAPKEKPVAAREEETEVEKPLAQAMEEIIEAAKPDDFKADGTPKAAVVNKYAGRTVSTSEREAAWESTLNS